MYIYSKELRIIWQSFTDLQFTFQSDEFQLRCSMWLQNCCIFKYYKC